MNRNDITTLKLSKKERAFVSALVEGGEPTAAALKSGYAESDAATAGWEMMHARRIAAAIDIEIKRALVAGAAVASRFLVKTVKDETAPAGVRVQAANSLLDRAGYVAPRQDAPRDGSRPLTDQSIDELRTLVDRLERERGSSAKDVTRGVLQHGKPSIGAETTDIYD